MKRWFGLRHVRYLLAFWRLSVPRTPPLDTAAWLHLEAIWKGEA